MFALSTMFWMLIVTCYFPCRRGRCCFLCAVVPALMGDCSYFQCSYFISFIKEWSVIVCYALICQFRNIEGISLKSFSFSGVFGAIHVSFDSDTATIGFLELLMT